MGTHCKRSAALELPLGELGMAGVDRLPAVAGRLAADRLVDADCRQAAGVDRQADGVDRQAAGVDRQAAGVDRQAAVIDCHLKEKQFLRKLGPEECLSQDHQMLQVQDVALVDQNH